MRLPRHCGRRRLDCGGPHSPETRLRCGKATSYSEVRFPEFVLRSSFFGVRTPERVNPVECNFSGTGEGTLTVASNLCNRLCQAFPSIVVHTPDMDASEQLAWFKKRLRPGPGPCSWAGIKNIGEISTKRYLGGYRAIYDRANGPKRYNHCSQHESIMFTGSTNLSDPVIIPPEVGTVERKRR